MHKRCAIAGMFNVFELEPRVENPVRGVQTRENQTRPVSHRGSLDQDIADAEKITGSCLDQLQSHLRAKLNWDSSCSNGVGEFLYYHQPANHSRPRQSTRPVWQEIHPIEAIRLSSSRLPFTLPHETTIRTVRVATEQSVIAVSLKNWTRKCRRILCAVRKSCGGNTVAPQAFLAWHKSGHGNPRKRCPIRSVAGNNGQEMV